MPTRPPQHKRALASAKVHRVDRPQDYNKNVLYGRRWKAAAKRWLQDHPLCAECAKLDRVTAATDVDHSTPHRGDLALFWASHLWQSLCHACHSRKTAAEDGGFGNKRQDREALPPGQSCQP